LQFSNVSLEIAQSPSRWFNHPMRRTVLSTFLFVTILGPGCMGVTVPSQAEELKHPIELGKECKVLFQEYYDRSRSDTDQAGNLDADVIPEPINFNFYNAFAYAYGATGKYACGYDVSPRPALERCNFMSSDRDGGEASLPPGATGNDLGGCKVYAKFPVNGKLAIVWKGKVLRGAVPAKAEKNDNDSFSLEELENKCTELGFIKSTEKHGDCVMKLYK